MENVGLLMLAGVLAIMVVTFGWTVSALVEKLERADRAHSAQIDRLMVLFRSKDLDQFAAVEKRLAVERRQEQAEQVAEGVVVPKEPVPEKRPGVLQQVWRRPPQPVRPFTDPE